MNGNLLEYSSIDVHNDYMIQEYAEPNVIGIVVQLFVTAFCTFSKFDAFTLTFEGRQKVEECSKMFNLAGKQHPCCNGMELNSLFVSCKYLVEEEIDGHVKLLDYRKTENPVIVAKL